MFDAGSDLPAQRVLPHHGLHPCAAGQLLSRREVSVVNESSMSSIVGLPLVDTPGPAHNYTGAATSAGPTRYVRWACFVLLIFGAALALPLHAHDNYTSWVEAVVHPDRLDVTLTLARTAALRL